MDERHLERIKKYLQDTESQQRIQQNIQRGKLEATVSIGSVAQLYDLKESKLRDWETRGLLSPLRSKEHTGQRKYTPNELEKLAIIKELIDEGGFSAVDIPENIQDLWNSVSGLNGQKEAISHRKEMQSAPPREADLLPIDQRVTHIYYKELFWRYYASHALRLAVMLICDEVSFNRFALILPLRKKNAHSLIQHSEDLPNVGESLVGWLGPTGSFYTFITPAPSVKYPSDFQIQPLQAIEEGSVKEDKPDDNTIMVIPRMEAESRPFTLSKPVVETIRRLISPLYHEVRDWNFFLGTGMRDIVDPFIDFGSNTNFPETILTGLAKRVVHLGGKTEEGQYRWRFCCVLAPNNPDLPFQQRSLTIRAKTKEAPSDYKVGTTLVSPEVPSISLSLRAYQSGRIIYRHVVTPEDFSVAHLELEKPIGSAIAVPVGGENELPIAVLYVVSAYPDAFSEDDQRLLRMVARMVEELLETYDVRSQVTQQFNNLVNNPGVVDPSFEGLASETDFINDIEALLRNIETKKVEHITEVKEQYTTKENVCFIAIDIDNLTSLTTKYGDRMTKNLSRVVGLKLQTKVRTLFTNPADCKLYHIYADRFYLLLNGISLEEARTKAEELRQTLNGSYQIDALRFSVEQPAPPESKLDVPGITVRLGVGSYTYEKLQEIIRRYPTSTSLASTEANIRRYLDDILKVGLDARGNMIMSWDPERWTNVRLSSNEDRVN
jgi:DNA-binding transcriptional MerR regulator/GGDEF domain-containing protein